MAEYIERNELINNRPEMRNPHQTGKEEYNAGWNDCVEVFLDAIKDQPVADVEPVKHGEWVNNDDEWKFYKCSICGNEAYWDTDYGQQLFDFCPWCGAKTDGKEVQE